MELEKFKKCEELQKDLCRLYRSKEHLAYFTKDGDDTPLRIYVGKSSDAFVVPKQIAGKLIDYLFNLLEDKIKELEQEFTEL